MKILVIGESCKDVFKYGSCERICPEAPALIFKPNTVKDNGGMAMNVFNNLKSLEVDVNIVTNSNWNEITKTRFVDKKTNYILLREDSNDNQYGKFNINNVDFSLYDGVIISDYDKGFLTESDIQEIAKKHTLTFLDTKKPIGNWCKDIAYIKINNYEFKKAKKLTDKIKDKLIVTLGPDGASHKGVIYPVSHVEIKDLSGAGDTFISGLAVKFLETNSISKAIEYANECATQVVQRIGVSIVK